MAIIADDAIRVYDDKKKTKKTRDEMRCKHCNGVIIYTLTHQRMATILSAGTASIVDGVLMIGGR